VCSVESLFVHETLLPIGTYISDGTNDVLPIYILVSDGTNDLTIFGSAATDIMNTNSLENSSIAFNMEL
jgi:hypothetical protein